MRSARSLAIIVMLAVLLLGNVSAVHPQTQSENCRYFPETRYHVCDEFLEFFESQGGVEIFGYPLTVAFEDPTHNGLRVQYFQRARMEWHPHNPEPYRVQLGLLADELGYSTYPPARPEQIPTSNSALHHYFPETQHVVSYAFLDYFREKGGLDIFGYPRSEFMYEKGYVVQYFQRARMEWHPEDDSGSQMRLTKLGETYIDRFGVPPEATSSDGSERIDPEMRQVTKMNISASVRYAITGRQGVQTVFVYVNDQQYQPVQGAAVQMIVHYQSGAQPYDLEPTDASGFTKWSFDILPSPPGKRVVIDVTVVYENVTGTTQTFFLPWW
jgi:hypothetical protein